MFVCLSLWGFQNGNNTGNYLTKKRIFLTLGACGLEYDKNIRVILESKLDENRQYFKGGLVFRTLQYILFFSCGLLLYIHNVSWGMFLCIHVVVVDRSLWGY